MSRPRFLADHDLNENIVVGLVRREPALFITRLRDVGIADRPDAEVLAYAAEHRLIVVSHDVNTMPAAASARLAHGLTFPGLLLARQRHPIAPVIESLLLIWSNSEAEEWEGQVQFLPL
jgi:hypothetical protein